jgi:hypothetical protein
MDMVCTDNYRPQVDNDELSELSKQKLEIYNLAKLCWNKNKEKRIDFLSIKKYLENLLEGKSNKLEFLKDEKKSNEDDCEKIKIDNEKILEDLKKKYEDEIQVGVNKKIEGRINELISQLKIIKKKEESVDKKNDIEKLIDEIKNSNKKSEISSIYDQNVDAKEQKIIDEDDLIKDLKKFLIK